jgi:hypothetical protein
MQNWEYCILDYETTAKASKSSSELVMSFCKGKVHYLKKGERKTERLFKIEYPTNPEDWRAIAMLGEKG